MRSLWLVLLMVMVPASAAELARPYVPAGDAVILQTLPSSGDPRVKKFEALQAEVRSRPRDVGPAIALARAYIDYARATGDARYLGRAQALIVPWLQGSPVPADALLAHAIVLQGRHQFTDARRALDQLLRRDPDRDEAWLTLAAVAQVQGDLPVARRACAHLLGSGDRLIAAGCIASLAIDTGNARGGYDALALVLQQQAGTAPELQAWAQGLLADAAKAFGDAALAETHFRDALLLTPGDNFLLAGYADLLLDQQRPREVLALLKDHLQSDTSFLRLVLAEAALQMPQAYVDIAQMARRFDDLRARGDGELYGREEARFALQLKHDPARALRIAQENWRLQRAPEDARILREAQVAAGSLQP